jgi:hypothetical protein
VEAAAASRATVERAEPVVRAALEPVEPVGPEVQVSPPVAMAVMAETVVLVLAALAAPAARAVQVEMLMAVSPLAATVATEFFLVLAL